MSQRQVLPAHSKSSVIAARFAHRENADPCLCRSCPTHFSSSISLATKRHSLSLRCESETRLRSFRLFVRKQEKNSRSGTRCCACVRILARMTNALARRLLVRCRRGHVCACFHTKTRAVMIVRGIGMHNAGRESRSARVSVNIARSFSLVFSSRREPFTIASRLLDYLYLLNLFPSGALLCCSDLESIAIYHFWELSEVCLFTFYLWLAKRRSTLSIYLAGRSVADDMRSFRLSAAWLCGFT